MDERERAQQIELATSGDADALQRLIVFYHGPLSGVLSNEIGPAERRYVDPDDLLQETYIAAYKSIAACRFKSPAAFYKWLETIAISRLKDQQRAARRQKRDVAREMRRSTGTRTSYPDLVDRLAAPDSTPSRRVRREEAVAAVLSSLARLTDDQRDVVRLRYLEGKSVAEVATRVGKSEVAVHSLCRRGLKALRESMVSISQFLSHL